MWTLVSCEGEDRERERSMYVCVERGTNSGLNSATQCHHWLSMFVVRGMVCVVCVQPKLQCGALDWKVMD